MQGYVDAGAISGGDLVYLMAEVGYTAYKGEERYNLPSGEVDHPVLNPDAALIDLLPDTAGYADWVEERKRKEREKADKKASGGEDE